MPQYEIKPFALTDDFENCWLAAGRHLNHRVKDTGSRWLRAELPPFREHLSFALGNQLFFVQVLDADDPHNGWFQPERLRAAVNDAKGVGCLMPMRRSGDEWVPVVRGWGLVSLLNHSLLDPVTFTSDQPVEMTPWEIHDVGVQAVRQHLTQEGWKIVSWQTDLKVDPSIIASQNDILCGFVVRTSDTGPSPASRPKNASQIAAVMHQRGWHAKFVGLKIADCDAPTHTDPRLSHLKRRLFRGSALMLNSVELQDLDPA